jgi:hypothetical protein
VDERRQQRAEVQIDLEDAQTLLSDLQVKAVRMADALDKVSAKIRQNAQLVPSPKGFDLDYEMKNRLSPDSQSALSYDAIIRVIEDLKVARQKVVNLTRQKNQLAAPANWQVSL